MRTSTAPLHLLRYLGRLLSESSDPLLRGAGWDVLAIVATVRARIGARQRGCGSG